MANISKEKEGWIDGMPRDEKGYWHPERGTGPPSPLFAWPPSPVEAFKYLFGFPGYLFPWNTIYFGIAIVTWLYFQPALSRCVTFQADWILEMFVRNLVLLVVIAGLIWAERAARRRRRFHHTSGRYRQLDPRRLSGRAAAAAFLACALPVLLGFLLPSAVLAWYAVTAWEPGRLPDFLLFAEHSLTLAGIAALAASAFGLALAYGARAGAPPLAQGAARFVSLGYAVPGAVLALGVMIPLAGLDRTIDAIARAEFGTSTGLLFSGTLFAVSAALTVRFLALAYGTSDAGLSKVTPNIDSAARTLGHGPFSRLRRVHLPIVRGSVLTGALLVFVDSMKELPMTLILRPFNYETLATDVYQFASDELLEECALSALAIVLAGVVPVVLLTRIIRQSRAGEDLIPHGPGER